MERHVVCRVDELPPGQRKIVEVAGRGIGVFNVKGSYYALRNRCPHHAGPLCQGLMTGLVLGPEPYRYTFERDGEILRCPWHGWEFDVTNGKSVFNPHRIKVRSYDVAVEPAEEEDASIETYPVSVERQLVVVYV
ncbi:MAG: Rieske (2Fe-2S) protein [Chloroflexota bacterium]